MRTSLMLILVAASTLGNTNCEDLSPEPYECDPQTCQNGCCLGETCVAGNTPTTCGTLGNQCAVCQSFQTCGGGSQQRCVVDRSTLWRIQPLRGTISRDDPNDQLPWDADESEPDVVVELNCPTDGEAVVVRTEEISSYTPNWLTGACASQAGSLLGKKLQVNVIDVDLFFDDPIFSASYQVTEKDLESGSKTLELTDSAGLNKVTLSLTPAQ